MLDNNGIIMAKQFVLNEKKSMPIIADMKRVRGAIIVLLLSILLRIAVDL